MDISSLHSVTSEYIKNAMEASKQAGIQEEEGFEDILQSAVDMVKAANDAQNKAEEAEMGFMLGYMTNTHDLMDIQEKADIALNYAITVRDKVIEAYKEIMNMQI
ncbi:flagellar hook-basal body complex protein FliE [Lachnospiraceae bacterium 29-84]